MKLGLGTVQFGLDYGINNSTGKPALSEARRIIEAAAAAGIEVLDTAADYGDSEDVLGRLLNGRGNFRVVTKTSRSGDAAGSVRRSVTRLGLQQLYGVLVHDFDQYLANPGLWTDLQKLRDNGTVKKIGFSLYFPSQLDELFRRKISFDLIQAPYSILDQRFENSFRELASKNIEVHVRSVFLQGLVFRDPESLPSLFQPVVSKLRALGQMAKETGKSIQSLCLTFANACAGIDRIIIGVDSKENLESNIAAITGGLTAAEFDILRGLREEREEIILPFNWKK